MIRVLQIIEDGRFGGIHQRVGIVSDYIKDDVYNLILFPQKDSEKFTRFLEKRNINYVKINLTRIGKKVSRILNYIIKFPLEVYNIGQIIKREEIELIHVNGVWQIKGVIVGILYRTKIIWSLNDTSSNIVHRLLFKHLLHHFADGFIVTCQRTKNYYFSQLKVNTQKPIVEIQAPVDTNVFLPTKRADRNGIIRIATLANINPNKGIEVFLKMAELIQRNFLDNVEFIIAGPVYKTQKEYYSSLLRLAEKMKLKKLRFSGTVEDVPEFFNGIDIFICTSYNESGPMTVWEAMSMEKPVVSTNVGDVKDYINDYKTGFIVPVGDFKSIAEKVKWIIENPEEANEMGIRARTQIKELDVRLISKKHVSFYERVKIGK